MKTIDDLPNELLDEIFAHVNPFIGGLPITSIKTVCKRWNRPFMTSKLDNTRLPKNTHLQAEFPRLLSLTLYPEHEFKFTGHTRLKELCLTIPMDLSALNCPCLARLELLHVNMNAFFDPTALKACLNLCQSLTHLQLGFEEEENQFEVPLDYNQAMLDIIQSRPCDYQGLGLEHLTLVRSYHDWFEWFDFALFCRLFQSPSLVSIKLPFAFDSGDQVTTFFSCFPIVSSMVLQDVSIVRYNQECVFEHVKHISLIKSPHLKVKLSSLLFQFPNLENLNLEWIDPFDITVPTRIKKLQTTAFVRPFIAEYFPLLQDLEFCVDDVNYLNLALHLFKRHCPRLVNLELRYSRDMFGPADLQLDRITFPCLKKFSLNGHFAMNLSMFMFLARHPSLLL